MVFQHLSGIIDKVWRQNADIFLSGTWPPYYMDLLSLRLVQTVRARINVRSLFSQWAFSMTRIWTNDLFWCSSRRAILLSATLVKKLTVFQIEQIRRSKICGDSHTWCVISHAEKHWGNIIPLKHIEHLWALLLGINCNLCQPNCQYIHYNL